MNDVGRAKIDVNVLVFWHDHDGTLRRLSNNHGLVAWVRELPSPLECRHVDRGIGCRFVHDLIFNDHGCCKEPNDDKDRDDRIGQLKWDVVLRLFRDRRRILGAIGKDRPDHRKKCDASDDNGGDVEALPEFEGAVRGFGDAMEGTK